MQRYKLAGCAAVLLLAMVSPGRSDDNSSDPFSLTEDPRVPKLISHLSDPDSTVRADSVQRLINLGEAARPALRRALATANPQTRSEIDRVLLHVPWIKPGDSEPVEQAFTGYAEVDAEQRCDRIDSFWLYSETPASPSALLRIVLNDPCTAVRWEAANALRNTLDENESLGKELVDLVNGTEAAPQAYMPPDQNAPLIAAAGWACRDKPAQCAKLLEKSLAMEEENPTAFRGQMDFLFLWLVDRAETLHQHTRMIQLLREQADRTPWNEDRVPDAVTDLFATQADFGPDDGFAYDLRVYQDYFTHPELVYSLGRLAGRKQHPVLAQVLSDSALLMGGLSIEDHYQAGRFLSEHHWNAAAERELRWCLRLSGGQEVNVYFELSSLADERTDDLAAAKYEEAGLHKLTNTTGMSQTTRYGKRLPWSADQAWAEVYWHYMRAAQQAHDPAAMKTNLDKLLATDQGAQVLHDAPGMAADMVPALQELGQTQLADSIFDAAYASLDARVTAAPEDPMPKNNLAWLCACSGKRLDEAAKLADQAVTLAPDDGACLDTQAEIYSRLGQSAKAAEIEAKALLDKPDDVYMARQLEKFRATAAAKRYSAERSAFGWPPRAPLRA